MLTTSQIARITEPHERSLFDALNGMWFIVCGREDLVQFVWCEKPILD
ncbi:MAG TPA: hypothetical protein VFA65_00315 [Bryobacteraceae bacterium]|nr:hypothetical protein [Bryobacteraceae bacterium]